jgi:diguanylate cyclase (GGDEF)-like protein/PAS domain S-box-containing protein
VTALRQPPRTRPRLRRTVVPVLVLALAIGATAIGSVALLQRHTERAVEAEVGISELRTQETTLRSLPWDYLTPSLRDGVQAKLTRLQTAIRERIDELRARNPRVSAIADLQQEHAAFAGDVGRMFAALKRFDEGEAQTLNDRRVNPRYARVTDSLDRLARTFETDAQWAEAVTVIGAAISLAIALALFAFLLVRARRSSVRAEEAEDALRASERQYRLLFEHNPNAMWVVDRETMRYVAVNEAAIKHYGYSREEFLSMTAFDIRPPEEVERLRAAVADFKPAKGDRWMHRRRDGSLIDVEVTVSEVFFGGRPSFVVLAVDVTAWETARKALAESEQRHRDLFENATVPIATVDMTDAISDVNSAFARTLGYKPSELIGTNIADYMAAEGRRRATEELNRKLSGEARTSTYEQEFIAADGRRIVFEVSTRLLEKNGEPVGIQGICRDVTEQRRAEAELRELAEVNRYQARHDALTGLPNRTSFREAVEDAIATARAEKSQLAVLVMDINRFKSINDALGHAVGDSLLRRVAETISGAVRESDVVGRLGGDEFAVLVRARSAIGPIAAEAAARIARALERPFTVRDLPLSVDASMGIALHPRHGENAEALLQHADVAMYVAKDRREPSAVYTEEYDQNDAAMLRRLGELRGAIARRELVLHYQPKLDLRTGEINRVEALVRWQHPSEGLLGPNDFVPLAEQTGLIRPLSRYVLVEALEQCRRWHDEGREVGVSVNLSGGNLSDESFVDVVRESLEATGISPGLLVLEVTETAIIGDPRRAETVIADMHRLGVKISLDDFGTGYSSLSFLTRLPLDQIKIDRSFVTRLRPDDEAIVRSIIRLGHDLGLEVVAEGVETADVWKRLRQFDCDLLQGYHLSPPLPALEFAAWLDSRPKVDAAAA